MKKGLLYVLCLLGSGISFGQGNDLLMDEKEQVARIDSSSVTGKAPAEGVEVYQLKPAVDIPLTAAFTAWTIYGFSQVYSKESSSEQEIRNLRRSDINGFDRWGSYVYSEKAADVSDFIFYGSMPLPVLLFIDKDIRQDAAKVSFLYLESMAVTGLLYTGGTYLFDRYRPYTYKPSDGGGPNMGDKTDGNAKNSFPAGHVALVANSTFFFAKVFKDYHPDSPLRHYLFGGAALATGVTAYLRHRGGRHFPSDILVGAAIGTLSGILVPHFHKNKLLKNSNLSIMPFTGRSHGLALTYRLDKKK